MLRTRSKLRFQAEISNPRRSKKNLLTEEELLQKDKQFSAKLVAAFIRRQEFRGSDVRWDLGSFSQPDAVPRGPIDPSRWLWHVGQSYPFQQSEHINVLELRALVQSFQWRLHNAKFFQCRALHLTDSRVALAVAVKGRSSSRQLNRLLGKFAALQVAGGIYPILGWIPTDENPADEPSRRLKILLTWPRGP